MTSGRWEHRPANGPVAWLAATLVATTVPLLCLILGAVILAVSGLSGSDVIAAAAAGWLVVGTVALSGARSRGLRGVGAGVSGGALVCLLLALLVPVGRLWG